MTEKELARQRIEADLAAYAAAGGEVTSIPTGVSGDKQVVLKTVRGRQVYKEAEGSKDWRKYDQIKYKLKQKEKA